MNIKNISLTSLLCFISISGFADVGSEFIERGGGPSELSTEEYIKEIKPFLPKNPVILEAGAHSGEDSIQFARAWPYGQVYAFEPVPLFYERLVENKEKHNCQNIHHFPFGIFSKTGEQTFFYSQNCGGASSFLPEGKMPETNYADKEVTLPCMKLDDWAHEYNIDKVDFMWLDMEGSEYHALSASSEILDTVSVILTELSFRSFREGHTLYHKIKPYLEERGFTLYKIWGSPNWQATGMFVRNELLNN